MDGPKVDSPKVGGPKVDGSKVDGQKWTVQVLQSGRSSFDERIGLSSLCSKDRRDCDLRTVRFRSKNLPWAASSLSLRLKMTFAEIRVGFGWEMVSSGKIWVGQEWVNSGQNWPIPIYLGCELSTNLKTTDRTVGQTNIAVAFDRRKVVSSNET